MAKSCMENLLAAFFEIVSIVLDITGLLHIYKQIIIWRVIWCFMYIIYIVFIDIFIICRFEFKISTLFQG